MKRIFLGSLIICGILFFSPVLAEENINVNLKIESPDNTILNQTISVPETCEVIDSTNSTSTHTGYTAICSLQAAYESGLILNYQVTNWGTAFAIDSINDITNATDWSETWLIYKNNIDPGFGIDGFTLNSDDNLILTYGPWPMEPLQAELSSSTLELGQTLILSTKYWNNGILEQYKDDVNFIIDNAIYNSSSGTLEYAPETEGQKEIYVEAVGKTRSEKVYLTVTPTTEPEPEIILATTTIHFQIETYDATLYNDDFVVTACEPTENTTSTSLTIYCALQQLSTNMGWNTTFNFSGDSVFLSSINNYDGADWNWWAFFHNLDFANEALNEYIIQENDEILLSYGTFPLKIEVSTTTPELNTTTTLDIKEFGFDLSWNSAWLDSSSSTLVINNEEYFTENGIYELEINTTTPYEIYGKKDGYLNTEIIYITATSSIDDTGDGDSTNDGDDDEGNTSGGGSAVINHNNLNIDKAIEFLSANQNEMGNFGSSDIYTDWVAIAFGAYNKNHETAQKIKSYLIKDPNPLVGMNEVSDYARRAMALMSLGINPYSDTATNYINKLIEKFDGTQFGDPNLYNDDIFAIIPLLHAGYNSNDEIISKTVNFILSKQTNGGWGSVDLTAATIQALSPLTDISQVSEALLIAKNKLKDTQTSNGGWGNIPSTAWAMQAISSSGENQEDWQNNNKTPDDYLYSLQASDGGLDKTNTNNDFRIWNTAYAIPASLKMDWNDIIQNFAKPNNENFTGGPSDTIDTATTTPTSTLDITTTTLDITTTTLDIVTTTPEMTTTTEYIVTTTENIITTSTTSNADTKIEQKLNKKLTNNKTTQNKYKNLQPTTYNLTSTPTIEQFNNETISSPTTSIPYTNTAKGVFATATAMASGLGLYLGWRFLLSLV